MSTIRKNNKNPIERQIDGNCLTQQREATEAFAACFKGVFNNNCMNDVSTEFISSDSLYILSISDSGVRKSIRRLRPSKFFGFDGSPAFIIKGSSYILIPVLKCIFNPNLSQYIFPTLWKQAAFVPIFKKGKTALENNYTSISIPNTFPQIHEIIIHDTFQTILPLDCSKCILNRSLYGLQRRN